MIAFGTPNITPELRAWLPENVSNATLVADGDAWLLVGFMILADDQDATLIRLTWPDLHQFEIERAGDLPGPPLS